MNNYSQNTTPNSNEISYPLGNGLQYNVPSGTVTVAPIQIHNITYKISFPPSIENEEFIFDQFNDLFKVNFSLMKIGRIDGFAILQFFCDDILYIDYCINDFDQKLIDYFSICTGLLTKNIYFLYKNFISSFDFILDNPNDMTYPNIMALSEDKTKQLYMRFLND